MGGYGSGRLFSLRERPLYRRSVASLSLPAGRSGRSSRCPVGAIPRVLPRPEGWSVWRRRAPGCRCPRSRLPHRDAVVRQDLHDPCRPPCPLSEGDTAALLAVATDTSVHAGHSPRRSSSGCDPGRRSLPLARPTNWPPPLRRRHSISRRQRTTIRTFSICCAWSSYRFSGAVGMVGRGGERCGHGELARAHSLPPCPALTGATVVVPLASGRAIAAIGRRG